MLSTAFLAGSFAIDDEARPRVITLDFPPLQAGSQEESRLLEHGMTQVWPEYWNALIVTRNRCVPCLCHRLSPRI